MSSETTSILPKSTLSSPTAVDTDLATETWFEGWYLNPTLTTPSPILCESTATWQSSGTIGGCCNGDPCRFATDCKNSVLSYNDGNTVSCDEGYSCIAITVYDKSGDPGTGRSEINCGTNWSAFTLYRTLADTTTSSSETTSETSTTSRTTSTPTPTDDGGSGGGGGGSKAWIAGAVVGPVVGLALLGALAFWCLRKRRKGGNTPDAASMAAAGGSMQSPHQSMMQHQSVYGQPSMQGSPAPQGWYNQSEQGGYNNQSPYNASGSPDNSGYYYQQPSPGGTYSQPQYMAVSGSPAHVSELETEANKHVGEVSELPSEPVAQTSRDTPAAS